VYELISEKILSFLHPNADVVSTLRGFCLKLFALVITRRLEVGAIIDRKKRLPSLPCFKEASKNIFDWQTSTFIVAVIKVNQKSNYLTG